MVSGEKLAERLLQKMSQNKVPRAGLNQRRKENYVDKLFDEEDVNG
jgi:hypothetical protein